MTGQWVGTCNTRWPTVEVVREIGEVKSFRGFEECTFYLKPPSSLCLKWSSGCCVESGLERAGEAEAAEKARDDHGWSLWWQEMETRRDLNISLSSDGLDIVSYGRHLQHSTTPASSRAPSLRSHGTPPHQLMGHDLHLSWPLPLQL